jgi:hypothetical protein
MADSDSERTAAEQGRDELREAVPRAASTLSALLDAEDESVRIRAAEAILDRAGVTKGKTISATAAERKLEDDDKDELEGLLR